MMAPNTKSLNNPVQTLLDRMKDSDKDFRFMATNDLIGELQRDQVNLNDDDEHRVTSQLLDLLKDQNGEVQNLAIKCLGFLIGKIKDDRRKYVIRELCQMLKHDTEQIRDISSIALKTIVPELEGSRRMIEIINTDLNPNLLAAISNKNDVNVQLEALDILAELICNFGSKLNPHHELMQKELMLQLDSDRAAVRKKSMNALAHLLAYGSDELFNKTVDQVHEALVRLAADPNRSSSDSKTLLQCLATIIRTAGHRTSMEQLKQIIPVINVFCQINDDEIREYCIQVFEAFVKRCPVNVNPVLGGIIQVCLVNIAHDPNYNYEDEDDGGDMDMDTDNNVDDNNSESAEDYSDDDDLSWKVRRASAKCIENIVTTRRDQLNEYFNIIAPVLLSRFKEREDSVKADIIQAFVAMLKQTKTLVHDSKCSETPLAVESLSKMLESIVNKSAGLLREKSVKTRQVVFQLYTEIMNILPSNALADHIPLLVPGILYSLVDKNSNSNMKIDALIFLQELVKTHEPPKLYSQVESILPTVLNAVADSFYKIASEAISLLSHLVCLIRHSEYEPMPGYEQALTMIYHKIIERVSRTGVDIEIKEQAIACMGTIIATFGDKMNQELPVALPMITEKLNNEPNRLSCVKALIKIANSPRNIPLTSVFPAEFEVLSSFLRKKSRSLKISTLILIENVVARNRDLLDAKSAQLILSDVPSLIVESDLYVSQLTLTMLGTLVKNKKAHLPIVPQEIIPQTLKLIQSPLLQGSALQSMLNFFTNLVQCSFPSMDHATLMNKLVEPINHSGEAIIVHKQTFSSTAKAIAAISLTNPSLAMQTIQQLIGLHNQNNNMYTLVLLSLGELGKQMDMANVPNLVDVILEAFNSSVEDIKSAGSYALGCIAVGNMKQFLPIILQEFESRSKRQYLILHSLREVISCGQLEHLEPVWHLLMKHCECNEEGTRNVVSECLGKLTLVQPQLLLPKLIHHLKTDYASKPLARATVIAAIKFTISDQKQPIDDLLRNCIGEFLIGLEDPDINVRRVSLITFNSAAHNKPSLILGLLPQLLPLLYKETEVKIELIREVEMGPFKHKVDDGLDSRKAAFECMYTLLDTCQNNLDICEFLRHVESGLKDHYDIKMLTYLMINRLAALCPSAVLQQMDRLIEPLEEVCRSKAKENAVKQEHDKLDELKRSCMRAVEAMRSIPNADRHPALARFDDLVNQSSDLKDLYESINVRTNDNTNGNNTHTNGYDSSHVQRMDLS